MFCIRVFVNSPLRVTPVDPICLVSVRSSVHPAVIPSVHHTMAAKIVKGIYLSKALTWMIFSCINNNCFFIKETDSFGQIVV